MADQAASRLLGALDKRLREGLQLEFRRIHRELGITFIYVTHDQHEALVMSDRIAVFNDGRIEQVGTAEELYERPSSLFVARFLGDSNVLTGEVRRSGGDSRLVVEGNHLRLEASAGAATGRAAIVIRPEKLSVVPAAQEQPSGVNTLSGRVREIIYMGALRRIDVEVGQSIRLVVQEQTTVDVAMTVGDQVVVSWDPRDAVLLPDADGANDLTAPLEDPSVAVG